MGDDVVVPFSGPRGFDWSRVGAEVAKALVVLQRVAETSGNPVERRKARAALEAWRSKRGVRHVRIWDERREEIEAAVAEIAASKAKGLSAILILHVLGKAAQTITLDSQRMSKSQAELAADLQLRGETVSRAFSVLAEVGAVMFREPMGKSVSWELDAEYCSRLGDAAREEAIARQFKRRVAERAAGLAPGAQGKLRLVDRGPLE